MFSLLRINGWEPWILGVVGIYSSLHLLMNECLLSRQVMRYQSIARACSPFSCIPDRVRRRRALGPRGVANSSNSACRDHSEIDGIRRRMDIFHHMVAERSCHWIFPLPAGSRKAVRRKRKETDVSLLPAPIVQESGECVYLTHLLRTSCIA